MRCLLVGTAAAILAAQTPVFEVASVKPSGPKSIRGSNGGPGTSDPGRYVYNQADLRSLIAIAYKVDEFQISSRVPLDGPAVDVAAKLPEGTTKPEFRLMLQNLLAERFHLKLHSENREFAAYELVIAKTGTKLKDGAPLASAPPGFPDLPPDRPGLYSIHTMSHGSELVRLRSQREPLSILVDILSGSTEKPVVDQTGLTGKYDFTLEFTGSRLRSTELGGDTELSEAPILTTALQQQLGLQLVSKKLSFQVLVIDAVEKVPTEN